MNRSMIKRVISFAIIMLAFYFLGRVLVRNWQKVDTDYISFNSLNLIFSYILLIVSCLLSFQIWRLILHFLGENITYFEAFSITSVSRIAKYIPGKIWGPIGRLYLAKNVGISYGTGFTSIILEDSLNVLSGLFVFFICLPFVRSNLIASVYFYYIIPIFILLLIFIHPSIWGRFINLLLRKFNKQQVYIAIRYPKVLLLLSFYIFVRLIHSLGFFYLIKSFYFIGSDSLLPVMGFYSLACVIGLLIFILPAGLGAKEGSLSFFLSLEMPASVGVLCALLARIWFVSVEICLFLFSFRKVKI